MQVGDKVKTIDGKEGEFKWLQEQRYELPEHYRCGVLINGCGIVTYLQGQLQPIEDKCPKCGKPFNLTPKTKGILCAQCEAPLKSDIFTICEKCWAIERQKLREKFEVKSEPEERDYFIVNDVPGAQPQVVAWNKSRKGIAACITDPRGDRIFKWSQGITG